LTNEPDPTGTIHQIKRKMHAPGHLARSATFHPTRDPLPAGTGMTPQRSIEYLTGFLMGSFLGFVMEAGLVGIYNLLAGWLGWARFEPSWWIMVLLPLLAGLVMSKAIAGLHLEDY